MWEHCPAAGWLLPAVLTCLVSCQGHLLNTEGLQCALLTFLPSCLISVASRIPDLYADLSSKTQPVHLGPSEESKQFRSVCKRQALRSDALSAFPLS